MARNEEKHFGLLNRLVLQKEKEEYEKKNPKRPRLDCLDTVEEIQKWLPSIKLELEFYLKKSEVVCYSDDHIEESKKKVVHLEKEYKAFVRKIARLTPGKLDAVPWTNRAYKRKNLEDPVVTQHTKGPFKPIEAPILKKEKIEEPFTEKHNFVVTLPYMDEPLLFKRSNEGSANSTGSFTPANVTPVSSSSGTKNLTFDDPINNVDMSNKHLSTLVDYKDSDSD